MNLHIITRLTRPEYIKKVWDSIVNSKNNNINIYWRVIIDILQDFTLDSEMLRFIKENAFDVLIEKGEQDSYGYLLINKVVDTIPDDDWFYILDDDNSINRYFLNEIIDYKEGFIVFDQLVGGRDFTGLNIREATPENMRWQGVDIGQIVCHKKSIGDLRFTGNYSGDGIFIESLMGLYPDKFNYIRKPLTNYNFFQGERKINRKLPRVLLFHIHDIDLKSNNSDFECNELTVIRLDKFDEDVLIDFDPDCIITIGDTNAYQSLCSKSFDIRQRWLHFNNVSDGIGEAAYQCSMNYILNVSKSELLVSIITPTYNTGDKLLRSYESIKSQSYRNWEWVIVDDSTDKYTKNLIDEISKVDSRIKLYRFEKITNGIIGEAKYRASMLSKGDILLEFDHDDELHSDACLDIVNTYIKYPDAGFYYSDCIELDSNNNPIIYGDDLTWGLGYGKYYDYEYKGVIYKACDTPNINPLTIRHIVGVPNHLRAWRRDVYLRVGSHNRRLSIADDYELIVRTFLDTKFVHIKKPLYIQHHHNKNSQNDGPTRSDIQRRVRTISIFYNNDIQKRFLDLNQEDWAFVDGSKWPSWESSSRYGDDESFVNYNHIL